jgi:hypothetical protein
MSSTIISYLVAASSFCYGQGASKCINFLYCHQAILSPKGFAVKQVFVFNSEALEVTYASKEPSNPLSIDFYNTEPGNDEVIIECRIRMRVRIRDSNGFTRFN